MAKSPILIAEVKPQSPFGFKSSSSWSQLFELAEEHGDWISIHTDPRWGGSFELIRKARALTDKPILAKGIHANDADIDKALEAGADYVLVVGRLPKSDLKKCLIEPNSLAELVALPTEVKAVWNARNLTNGQPKTEDFSQARAAWSGWLCQASFITRPTDIEPGADAILVGEQLGTYLLTRFQK